MTKGQAGVDPSIMKDPETREPPDAARAATLTLTLTLTLGLGQRRIEGEGGTVGAAVGSAAARVRAGGG